MQFNDSETQRLLRSTARSYLAHAYPWERLYRLEADQERLSESDVKEYARLGWFGLLLPEAAGGGGASLLDAAVVIEELGYAGVPAPVTAASIAAHLLLTGPATTVGVDELERVAGGERLYTISEATRDPSEGTLRIAKGKIDGALALVPFAGLATYAVAPATVEGEVAFGAFPLRGAELKPVGLLDRRGHANVRFAGVPDDEVHVLATGVEARELHDSCDALATAFSLVEMSGMMQRILEMTAAHITTRHQFGQPIAKFQAARHRAAELLVQAETTRWAAYHALWRFQNDPTDRNEIWLAKHWASRAVDRVFQNSHMLHGGVGVGMEYPLHLYTQGITAFAVRGGTMGEMVRRTIDSWRPADKVAAG